MMENAIYTVISPEGCSAILWKDQDHVAAAAEALKLTAQNLLSFGFIDEIIPEPALATMAITTEVFPREGNGR